MGRLPVHLLISALCTSAIPVLDAAYADDWIEPGDETIVLGAGYFLPYFDSKIRVDNTRINAGDEVNLEDDLGLQSSETIAWLSGSWRFGANHRVSMSYFQILRSASATALRNITIGEETYPVGATLSTRFRFQSLPITYHYSFIKSPKHEFSGTAGLQWNTIELNVNGSASVGSGSVDGVASAKSIAPLPLLGLEYSYHANRRWTSDIHAEVFAIDIGDDAFSFSGSFHNVRASTEYWFYNHFGAGVALNWFDLDVDVEDDDWKGTINYQYIGPQVYIQTRF